MERKCYVFICTRGSEFFTSLFSGGARKRQQLEKATEGE
jgi:hypothetical protein